MAQRLLVQIALLWPSSKNVGVCLKRQFWLSLQTSIKNVSLRNLSMPPFAFNTQED